MTIRKRVHMIQVLSKIYRETCLPYPTNIVETVHRKLPLIANKRNEDLLTIIKVCCHYVDFFIIIIVKEDISTYFSRKIT
jgi:hypothetical protein